VNTIIKIRHVFNKILIRAQKRLLPNIPAGYAMDQMVFLAYDGSINADWISRYAMHMASNSSGKKLGIFHVLDGVTPLAKIQAKLETIKNECRYHGVDFTSESLRMDTTVYNTLLKAIPAGDEIYCLCGLRTSSMGKGFLAGTISEQLLRCKRFNVLAIRVVNPGLLGCPADILFPLAGHPRGFQTAMPFFMMLAPSVHKLQVLRIMCVNPLWFRYMSASAVNRRLRRGEDYVRMVIDEIREETDVKGLHLDSGVVLSDDWAKEVIIQASKLRNQMILLGASDRSLPSRFFYGNKIEQILRKTPCDVGIYRKI
jgi:hypothetical protein